VCGAELSKALLRTKVLAADCRVRLLNFISDAPVDCPVAVIFGHADAMNWAGPAYNDTGHGTHGRPLACGDLTQI